MSVVAAALVAGSERLAMSQSGSDQAALPVLTGEELFAYPEAMAEGVNVRLEGAVVRAKSGIVLRVAADDHEIFVAPIDPSSLEFLAVGSRINVQGTLHAVPTAKQAQLVYAMGPKEARRLARSRFYLDAWALSAVD